MFERLYETLYFLSFPVSSVFRVRGNAYMSGEKVFRTADRKHLSVTRLNRVVHAFVLLSILFPEASTISRGNVKIIYQNVSQYQAESGRLSVVSLSFKLYYWYAW